MVLCTGGYGNVFYLSTNAKGCNVTATWRAYKRGAFFANPCYTQIHPTCIPVSGDYQSKLTLMCESLRNDGRVWVPKKKGDKRPPDQIPEDERDYYLERKYPSFGNLAPRDIASRAAKEVCDEGRGVGPGGLGVYLDFADAIKRARAKRRSFAERYGNLFDMYERITGENAYKVPMRIYPAVHYTMGGLWVDYNLMSTIPGLFVLGEANFSDHGANRLGASALMQGLADGYFVIPYTIGELSRPRRSLPSRHDRSRRRSRKPKRRCSARIERLLSIKGKTHRRSLPPRTRQHRCGTSAAWRATRRACEGARSASRSCARSSGRTSTCPATASELNQILEHAGRVADFLEFAELLCLDALHRSESAAAISARNSRRPTAKRCATTSISLRGRLGIHRRRHKRPSLHKEPLDVRRRPSDAAELQVGWMPADLAHWQDM